MVENIEKPRQPYPSYEAIYILTPCLESCSRLVDDFSRKEGPMYAAAHVHFINGKYQIVRSHSNFCFALTKGYIPL